MSSHFKLIVYGPNGSGRYSQVVRMLAKYSPSRLAYDRFQVIWDAEEKHQIGIRYSDVHCEMDLSVWGHGQKDLWQAAWQWIENHTSPQMCIVLCNFQDIHYDLLSMLPAYLSQRAFLLVTNAVSFIPEFVRVRFAMIRVRRPTADQLKSAFGLNVNLNPTVGTLEPYRYGIVAPPLTSIDPRPSRQELSQAIISRVPLHSLIYRQVCDRFFGFATANQLAQWMREFNDHMRPLPHLERMFTELNKSVSV